MTRYYSPYIHNTSHNIYTTYFYCYFYMHYKYILTTLAQLCACSLPTRQYFTTTTTL